MVLWGSPASNKEGRAVTAIQGGTEAPPRGTASNGTSNPEGADPRGAHVRRDDPFVPEARAAHVRKDDPLLCEVRGAHVKSDQPRHAARPDDDGANENGGTVVTREAQPASSPAKVEDSGEETGRRTTERRRRRWRFVPMIGVAS